METRHLLGYADIQNLQNSHIKTTLSSAMVGIGSASFVSAILKISTSQLNLKGGDAAIAWAIVYGTCFALHTLINRAATNFDASSISALLRQENERQKLYLYNSPDANLSSHVKTAGLSFGVAAGFTCMALCYSMVDDRALLFAACLALIFSCQFGMRQHIRSDFNALARQWYPQPQGSSL